MKFIIFALVLLELGLSPSAKYRKPHNHLHPEWKHHYSSHSSSGSSSSSDSDSLDMDIPTEETRKRSNKECKLSEKMLFGNQFVEPHGVQIGIVTAKVGLSLETGADQCREEGVKIMILGTGYNINNEDGFGFCIIGSCVSVGFKPTWFKIF